MAEDKEAYAHEQVKEIVDSPSAQAIHDAIYKEA